MTPIRTLLAALCIAPLAHADTHTVWFDAPTVPARWETDSLPIGNGRLGALLFGGVDSMFVHFNENSLWLGDKKDTGSYQSFGNFTFDAAKPAGPVTGYRRALDLRTAVVTESYVADGVQFTRRAIASNPAKVIALECVADRPGAFSGTIRLGDDHEAKATVSGNDTLVVSGKLKNGMSYASRLKVVATGGKLENRDGALVVTGADSLRFYLTAGTDYVADAAKNFRGAKPDARIAADAEAAAKTPFPALLAAHTADHRQFFDRCAVDLGASDPALDKLTTKDRLIRFAKTHDDPDFEELVFQFGRYALIASSRPGSLPANLQGLWNRSNTPAWRCDYHSDINVDMNYWPSEVTNLSELRRPFIDWLVARIPVLEQNTKKHYGPTTRGWTSQMENGVHGGGSYAWDHSAGAWFAQQFRSHYDFTLDKTFLRDTALPVFRGAAEFWESVLIVRDGVAITPAGWSPEHGPREEGISYDLEFAWDALTNYIDTCALLGVEKDHAAKATKLRDSLLPLKIGKRGQLQEWTTQDRDRPKEDHRHLSHLVGVYPGRQIDSTTPALFAAAKQSLIERGEGGAGFSFIWKAALWARYRDGERARNQLNGKLTPVLSAPGHIRSGSDGTAPNLGGIVWSTFQMENAFGYPAAVAEMLIQSNEPGKLDLLPALPAAWKTGSFTGMKARGGHTVDAVWKDGELVAATVVKGPGELPKLFVKGVALAPGDKRVVLK